MTIPVASESKRTMGRDAYELTDTFELYSWKYSDRNDIDTKTYYE